MIADMKSDDLKQPADVAAERGAFTVVGAYARVDTARADDVRRSLADIGGVEPFDLGDDEKVGLLIEAGDLEAAHTLLTVEVRRTPGVLGVWPISVHVEDSAGADRPAGGEGAEHAIEPT